jgi:hypothetical protein
VEIFQKALTPILAGLLIAFAGYWTERTLTRISSREESARLVTELQVKREQAESDLRKDVFDQALKALLDENLEGGGVTALSKRLLKLELLALNFGDSLSLSPFFAEFKRDLNLAEPVSSEDREDHAGEIAVLKRRLEGLAKRVASSQLSSVAQHGTPFSIRVPLDMNVNTSCDRMLYSQDEYKWPVDEAKAELAGLEEDPAYAEMLEVETAKLGRRELDDVLRDFTLTFSEAKHCSKTARVNLSIETVAKNASAQPSDSAESGPPATDILSREFRLDFFNFPKIDNTRLSDNQRFAIIMEVFNAKDDPHLDITGVIFPAEYASLRDRPGMQEALELLQRALQTETSAEASADAN